MYYLGLLYYPAGLILLIIWICTYLAYELATVCPSLPPFPPSLCHLGPLHLKVEGKTFNICSGKGTLHLIFVEIVVCLTPANVIKDDKRFDLETSLNQYIRITFIYPSPAPYVLPLRFTLSLIQNNLRNRNAI